MRYQPVFSSVWRNDRFKYEFTTNAKLLWLYLLTCDHANSIGLYKLSTGYATADLGWRADSYKSRLSEILKPGKTGESMAWFDEKSQVICISRWLHWKPLQNENQVKGAIKALDEVPPTRLLFDFNAIVEQLEALRDKPLYKPLLERLAKRLGKGFPKGSERVS